MKKIIFMLILVFTVACKNKKSEPNAVIDDEGNLVGITNKEQLSAEPNDAWFVYNYDTYEVDSIVVEKLKPLVENVKIKAFMGTWCSDSQEQVPVFYKVFDATGFNYNNLEMIAVDRSKKTPDNLQEGLNIERVPTYIFYKNEVEIGRFVEYPRENVEADILKIVSGEPYKHSYEE